MKVTTIVGARPQFIKAAPVSKVLREAGHQEITVHTGQHYDYGMSEVFFEELGTSEPDVNLNVGSGSHGWQTGQMLIGIEEVLVADKPDWVLVYGDTNSTLAGALAAVKLYIPVAHVEAGLRSFNRAMPEEHNRVLTDHCSNLLFCPTETAVNNLRKEGLTNVANEGKLIDKNLDSSLFTRHSSLILNVGDVMYDSVLYNIKLSEKRSQILERLKLKPKSYALATIHRPENTDDHERLKSIFYSLERISQDGLPVISPLHPRTRKQLVSLGISLNSLQLIDPVSYLDMLLLEKQAQVILTDSGGVQKEAYWFGVPCITLRNETEWVETLESGWNVLVGSDTDRIVKAVKEARRGQQGQDTHGKAWAAQQIVHLLSSVSA